VGLSCFAGQGVGEGDVSDDATSPDQKIASTAKNPKNTPPLTVGISKCRRGIFGFLFRIDDMNGRMGPKN
jgi:hypothetical protein